MTKWLERARREISEMPDRGAAKRDVRTLTTATAAPHPALFQENGVAETLTDQGDIIAVLICSEVLEAEIWFSLRDDWKPDPGDQRAVFFASKLPLLRTKTPTELRAIHKVKLTWPGSKVRQ